MTSKLGYRRYQYNKLSKKYKLTDQNLELKEKNVRNKTVQTKKTRFLVLKTQSEKSKWKEIEETYSKRQEMEEQN